MKKLLQNCLIIAVAAFLSAFVLQHIVDIGLKRMNAHSNTQTSIEELLSDTLNGDIVIMGNSRALCSYNPITIEHILHRKVWNIGVSGQPFGISYMRYHLYIQHNKKPKLVIVNIDNNELDMISNGFGREEYYPYLSDSIIRTYIDLYGFTWKHIYIPMYKYLGDYKLIGYGLLSAIGFYPFPSQTHYHGFYNANNKFDGNELRNQLLKDSIFRAECSEEAICLLNNFIGELQQQNIHSLLCYAPQYKELYQHLQIDSCLSEYRYLSETYNIPLLDYSSLTWTNDSTYFYNANHVNLKGSELFSTQLALDMDSLFIISPQ